MASGRLGAADLTAATNTSLYTVPTGKLASFSVCFCNRTSIPALVRLAIATVSVPTNAEWVLYDIAVDANGSIERTGLILEATKITVVYSNIAGVTATAYGFEE